MIYSILSYNIIQVVLIMI